MVKKSLSSHPQAAGKSYKNISAEAIDLAEIISKAHHPKSGSRGTF